MLTSCKEHREGDVTGAPSETTSLTLTDEIIPENNPDSSETSDEIIKSVELSGKAADITDEQLKKIVRSRL